MTLFSAVGNRNVNCVYTDNIIVYENGARVKTAFATSLGKYAIRTSPELDSSIRQVTNRDRKKCIKYKYPDEVLTANDLFKISKAGVEFKIERNDIFFIRQLEAQKNIKKTIFGGGFLLSKKVAAEKVSILAEKNHKSSIALKLSEYEKSIVDSLGKKILKRWNKKMTKKRFIKLVMSLGISRNRAVELSKKVELYGSYEKLYKKIQQMLTGSACKVLKSVAFVINEWWDAVAILIKDIKIALQKINIKF